MELVEAAIASTERVNPDLNGLAYEAFDRARRRAAAKRPYGGYFDGVPTFVKDNVAIEGMPMMQGTDAWEPHPGVADGDFARDFLATGVVPLGRTRMSEFGFSGSAEHPRLGPVRNPWNPAYSSGASSSGAGVFVASGVVPIAHANDGGGSIHNPKLPRIGDVRGPGKARLRVAVCTQSIARVAGPEVTELTLKTAALLEELGHRVTIIDNPVPSQFKDDFLLYWAFLAFALIRGGRRTFGPTFDASKLDNLSRGLERAAAGGSIAFRGRSCGWRARAGSRPAWVSSTTSCSTRRSPA